MEGKRWKIGKRDKDYYLFSAQMALEGLCALFKTAVNVDCLSEDEVAGIGEIIRLIKEQVEKASEFNEKKAKKRNPKREAKMENLSEKTLG